MITRKTVLVLGAGASVPFGFPSGQLLLDIIRSYLYPDGDPDRNGRSLDFRWVPSLLDWPLNEAFRMLKSTFPKASLAAFGEKLYTSGEESIDAFLEYQTGEFLEIDKAAIAAVMLAFERGTALYQDFMTKRLHTAFTEGRERDGTENNWYQLLWSALSAPFEKFGSNQLRVVTFNYDRSLEHYLFTCLKNKYPDKKDDEYSKLICPIVHIHGSLGPLSWQEPVNNEDWDLRALNENWKFYVPYDLMYKKETVEETSRVLGLIRTNAFKIARRRITVIHESEDETPELVEAREWINDSDRLIFMGFGYHQTNLSRLKIEALDPRRKEIIGTIFRLSRGRYVHICDLVNKLSIIMPDEALFDDDVYTFLYNKVDLTT